MKTVLLLITGMTLSFSSFSQNEPSKNLPPLEMLKGKPGSVKHIYELPSIVDYKVYDKKGKLISEGKGKWVDYTKYKQGTYFIKYDAQTKSFEKQKK
jgi:hypothetical protein